MGEVAERLADLTVTVSSPDGNIEAEVYGGRVRWLEFRPGAYQRYDESELAHQLERLATLAFVNHDRGVQKIMEDVGLHRPRGPAEARDEAHRRYLADLPNIHATGVGPRQLVRFEATGLLNWRCDIVQGTLRQLSEQQFIAEVIDAAQALLQQHRYETGLLRNEIFGLAWTEATKQRVRERAAQRRW
ncbi:MAG TPA: hypothetical protein VIL37_02705 [Natronosporangium sp.]